MRYSSLVLSASPHGTVKSSGYKQQLILPLFWHGITHSAQHQNVPTAALPITDFDKKTAVCGILFAFPPRHRHIRLLLVSCAVCRLYCRRYNSRSRIISMQMIRDQYPCFIRYVCIQFVARETKGSLTNKECRLRSDNSIIRAISCLPKERSDAVRPLLTTQGRHSQSPRTPLCASLRACCSFPA
jgi:hypothetical protein